MNIFKDYREHQEGNSPFIIDPKIRKKREYEKRGFNLSHGKGKSEKRKKKKKKRK